MERISDEQKAIQIAREYSRNYGFGCNIDSSVECYQSATEAMRWKDEKFQKVLDYAENCYGVFSFEQREKFINRIKDIFYEKE